MGWTLWADLIPVGLKQLYLRERADWAGKTLLLLTDEPYIPWELVWPYDRATRAAWVTATVERFGRIDALVNNAGIADPGSTPVDQLSLEQWNRVIGVNLTGPMLCAKHCTPHLRKQGGAIVNISSTRAFQSEANTEAYSASKGGIFALTHALAVSLGPDVRVNCITPGWIETRPWKKQAERVVRHLRDIDHGQHPAGRVGAPEDVA
ncbi:MAG: SDR family oxidoreductase, partial [Caldilineaceae bacterium]|nr:SDR family oxidoreductase [Caldilineaceae bacterium]